MGGLRLNLPQRYLSGKGARTQLSVIALDAAGQPVNLSSLPLRFTSLRPSDFSVDANGLITALVEDGFSEILVSLDGSQLNARQLISVSTATSGSSGSNNGGSSGSSSTPPTQERVEGTVSFEFDTPAP